MAGDQKIGDPVTVVGGSGGGSSAYSMLITNLLDEPAFTVTDKDECILEFSYVSVDENGLDDGPGIGRVFIDSSQVAVTSIL
jgi:ABC-type dipeptide/oligopeptide/nickel transport system ATPase component